MSDTTFVDKVTHIVAAWLNDVNKAIYRAIGTGVGGIAPTTPADVRTNLGLAATAAPSGASLIGFDKTVSGFTNDHVQSVIDELHGIVLILAQLNHQTNNWDDANSPGNAQQTIDYINPATPTLGGHDWGGWVAYVHNQGTNWNNITPLVGHGYHDATFDNLTGATWGVVTEAWSNPTNYTSLVGGEFAVIAQDPDTAAPSIGTNSVFKNRLDGVTTLPAGNGLYNRYSTGVFISSQARPLTGDTAAGSGWNAAIRVGDLGFGSGLDWEGGSHYPGSSTYKAYSMVLDLTNALTDLAGGYPWHTLYKNSLTYWGMRFNGELSGSLDTNNVAVNAGGAGYNIGEQGTIAGGGGLARYQVADVVAGAVTKVNILSLYRGYGYGAGVGVATTATTGVGAGLTLNIFAGTGYVFGGDLAIGVAGAGYHVNDIVTVNGATAGTVPLSVKITGVSGGLAVTAFELITTESIGNTGVRVSQGVGYTVGNHATTNVVGTGAGFQVAIFKTYTDITLGGEKWEYWRMSNPSNPTATGSRDYFIDAAYPPLSRTIGLKLDDSYSAGVVQAITPSSVPTLLMSGTKSTDLFAIGGADPMVSAAAVGAVGEKIRVQVGGLTRWIQLYQ